MANSTILLIARVLLALLFIIAGFGKIGNVDGIAQYMASSGVPGFLAWPAILFEMIAGLFILAGFMTRYTAWALAIFCVATGILFHFVPADQNQMTQLFKNLALAGGFLALSVAGPGAYSVDARRAQA